MRLVLALSAIALIVSACANSTAPTPAPLSAPTADVAAIQTQAAGAVFATQTAAAPKPPATRAATNTPNPTNTVRPTEPPTQTATPQPTVEPIRLSGTGKTATKSFTLNEGLVLFHVTHNGQANIIVELLDDQGDSKALAANAIGKYSGSKVDSVRASGKYLFDVLADGDWTIEVTQPIPVEADLAPALVFKGCGQQVTPFFKLAKGLVRFESEHKGKSNFIAELYAADGNNAALVANEVGNTRTSSAEGIRNDGLYLLNVQADGEWTITVQTGESPVVGVEAIDTGGCGLANQNPSAAPTTVAVNSDSTPNPTSPPKPTSPPPPKPTEAPKLPPVPQDQTVKLNDQWDATLISVRRDKTLFGRFDNAETAFGVYASILFRIKNNASGSDHIGNTLSFKLQADGGAPQYYKLFNTLEDKAQYYYACCKTAFSTIPPGAEEVIVIVFDVPENTKTLSVFFTPANPFERDVPTIGPEFVVPNFDQIPPRGEKP